MKTRILPIVIALVIGMAVSVFVPGLPNAIRSLVIPSRPDAAATAEHGKPAKDEAGHAHGAGEEDHGAEGVVALSQQRIDTAGIQVAAVGSGSLSQGVAVPATITANANTLAHIPATVAGTLKEVRKQLGDTIARGEVLAIIESREIAEAKSEYLAALRSQQLAQTVLRREKSLWDQRVSAEQDYIQARATAEEAGIRVDLARQKLTAIGIDQAQITALPQRGAAALRVYEVRAPLAGRVIARTADLGASVEAGRDLFTIADLSSVWVEMVLSPTDLSRFKEGQKVTVKGGDHSADAKLIFVSPVVNNETRTARAVALLANADGRWRPGDYVLAAIETGAEKVDVLIPRSALQSIGGEQVVFVRTAEGFEKREVVLGRGDDNIVEVVFGLDAGESIAVTNSFVLKAELGKAEAEHSH
jgi:cobalt-zinc-cadmium efflux system membrane fusion protein